LKFCGPQPSAFSTLHCSRQSSPCSPGQMTVVSQDAHGRGECRPCAYFQYKDDGCRLGDDCKFCHLCDRADIKQHKKLKKQQVRVQAAQRWGSNPLALSRAEVILSDNLKSTNSRRPPTGEFESWLSASGLEGLGGFGHFDVSQVARGQSQLEASTRGCSSPESSLSGEDQRVPYVEARELCQKVPDSAPGMLRWDDVTFSSGFQFGLQPSPPSFLQMRQDQVLH
ncbi:unnamed protein product, partial [Polarella glacialis]